MWPKVEAWSHRVCTLYKIAKRYPQSECAGLGVSLQLDLQYLQRTVPGFGSLMGNIEDTLREAFLPAPFGREEVSIYLIEILSHRLKRGGLGITDPQLLEERA